MVGEGPVAVADENVDRIRNVLSPLTLGTTAEHASIENSSTIAGAGYTKREVSVPPRAHYLSRIYSSNIFPRTFNWVNHRPLHRIP